jgi:4-hydroxy-3-polyprenylbenzoate decarboxylase
VVKHGVCQEVVLTGDQIDLEALPVLQCWPLDAGRYITLPLVFTRHPRTGARNVGMYRLQVFDKKTTGMHWHLHKDAAEHYRASTGRMEVAVAIGTDPALTYAATAPLPGAVDEMLFAGFLRGEAVDLVQCRTVDLQVPVHAEFVLEGYVDVDETRVEGPFGDHTGYYSPAAPYPVFHLTCLTHRREAIYPATVVGRPPMEDCYLGKITERLFLPLVRLALPELVDINLPIEGIFHNLALVSIRKAYPGHAYKVMQALWGMGQFAFTKIIAVFDEEVDVQDWGEAVWRLGNNIDPERDVQFVRGPVDTLNHAAPRPGFGSKMGVDATRKWPEEGFDRQWPEDIRPDPAAQARAEALWQSLQPGGTR